MESILSRMQSWWQPETQASTPQGFQFFRLKDVQDAMYEVVGAFENMVTCQNDRDPIRLCEIKEDGPLSRDRIVVELTETGEFVCWDVVALGAYVFRFAKDPTHEGQRVPHPTRAGQFLTADTLQLVRSATLEVPRDALETALDYVARTKSFALKLTQLGVASCVVLDTTTGLAHGSFTLAMLSYYFMVLCTVSAGAVALAVKYPPEAEQVRQEFADCNRLDWHDEQSLYQRQLQEMVRTVLALKPQDNVRLQSEAGDETW